MRVAFLKAAKSEERTRSNFAVAGPLCLTMALGIIAQRLNEKLQFDPQTKRFTNSSVANDLLAGVPPRNGWAQYYRL